MLQNYLKTAFRNLWRKRQISAINFLGMLVALTVVMLIFIFIHDEQRFDQFHANKDSIYRVITHSENGLFGTYHRGFTGIPQGPAFTENVDEIEAFVRVKGYPELIRQGENSHYADVVYVDSNFFDVFSFKLRAGDAKEALKRPDQVIISEAQAHKFFDEESAIGKTIDIQLEGDQFDRLTIAAVAETPPGNSSIQFDFILPFIRYELTENEEKRNDWISSFLNTFVVLKAGATPQVAEDKFVPIVAEKAEPQLSKIRDRKPNIKQWYGLQALTDIHLQEELVVSNGLAKGSNPQYSFILIAVALLVILIASINFINLSLAQSLDRSREVGVRKVIGSSRKQLIFQFLAESWVLVGLTILPALALVQYLLPTFNSFTGKALPADILYQWPILVGLLVFQLLLSLLAGFYPALILSRFKPIQALSNRAKLGGRYHWAKGLVVVQFTLAILFVMSALFFHRQFEFLQDKDLGYEPENLIGIELPWFISNDIAPLFKESLQNYPFVEEVTARGNISKYGVNQTTVGFNGDQSMTVAYGNIDAAFIPAFGIQLQEGENFNPEIGSDTLNKVIVNETFVKRANLTDPIGQSLRMGEDQLEILAVVKDFHTESLKEEIKPLVMYCRPNSRVRELWVKTSDEHAAQTIKILEDIHEEHLAYLPFEYSFLESDLDVYYQAEARWKKVVNLASVLMLLIAALGIMGLSALSVVQRRREIGIRKVLGATVKELVALLSLPLIRLVGIAFLIATPIAWWAGQKWLASNYAFHIEIQWWMFALVGLSTLLLAFVTVGKEAVVRARANPVQSLQQE